LYILSQSKLNYFFKGYDMAGLSCGIVGLPNVGKSTLFNALTKNQVAASNYPFCTIDPNVGIVNVKDSRLKVLSDMSKSHNIIYATTTFVDIAGLVKGAASGEGLGNKFLANIRQTDVIAHVVRCFEDDNVVHVDGGVDPIRDIEVINLELILSDLQMVENIIQKTAKLGKAKKEVQNELKILEKIQKHLNESKPLKSLEFTVEEKEEVLKYPFLTNKTVIYVPNVSEEDLPEMDNAFVRQVKDYAAKEGSLVVPICAKLEGEIAQLSEEDSVELLSSLGLSQSGLDRLIKTSFEALGLITFLTTGDIETRAWTIIKGTLAPQAAGKIHSDIQKGFIRAEVVSFDDMVTFGSRVGAKEAGRARAEGKDYIVKDGDVIIFLHN
jgi:GTP-binding protein YchF